MLDSYYGGHPHSATRLTLPRGPSAAPGGAGGAIAPLEPGHAPSVRRHLERLSAASRYLRFGTAMPRIDDALVTRLAGNDGHRQVAWGAFDGADLLAMGMLVRLRHAPDTAEFALTVLDRVQGRGLGRRMLRHMAAAAPGLGIRNLSFYVLGENRRMLRLLSAAGVDYRISGGAAEGVVPVRELLIGLDTRRRAA